MNKTYIIAEAGVNHNGDIELAKELILKAKEIGADCIKFQTFKTENLITPDAPKANYQLKTTNPKHSQFTMLKNLELSYSDFSILFEFCKKTGIDFISTPYNFEDVDFLDKLGVDCFKIASGQLTELPFIKYIAKKNKKIILSSGMSNLAEIFEAVEIIKNHSTSGVSVLQCTTNYPSEIEDANLNCIKIIRASCDVKVGYSDHVIGNYACFSAVALGATIIEKHFTLDKKMSGPDHLCSSDPSDFKELVLGIRNIEKSLGSSIKRANAAELKNILGMKRSIVAKSDIKKGEIFNEHNLIFKRPNRGLDVNYYEHILGKKALNDIKINEFIELKKIQWTP
tara:strand:- start:248 stop:1267 length:1020 start_codon:yes stop_codon:yes gene_type:complete